MKENSYYAAGNGVYCSVTPTAAMQLLLRNNITIQKEWHMPCQWHVTIVYDESSQVSPQNFSILFPQTGSDIEYEAIITGTSWFPSASDPALGSIVILLDSSDLQRVQWHLFDLFNFKSDYADFKPHLTLAEDQPIWMVPNLDHLVGKVVRLGGFRIESVK